MNVQQQTDM